MEQSILKYENVHNAFLVFEESVVYYQNLLQLPSTTSFAGASHDKLLQSAQRSLIPIP
jgi:hypothetical protein